MITAPTPVEPAEPAEDQFLKPLLRGWSHGLAALVAVAGTIVAAVESGHDVAKLAGVLIYGISLVILLGFSATYHIPNWSPRRRALMRRIDHANIFLLIAGTYTPICAVLLGGGWRITMLTLIWTVALLGIALSSPALAARRRVLVSLYLAMGWLAVITIPKLFEITGAAALLLVLGGLLYTIGAIAYATGRPRLWPRVFGYHEVFHLFVIAASVSFYIFIVAVVVPHPVA